MAEKRPLVFNVQKFSVHDGPGIRTTIFFKGCPLACPWCHNPESQRFEVEKMERSDGGQDEVGTYYSVAELVRQAVQDQIFYERSGGGVTLSGGEVLAQPMGYIAGLWLKKAFPSASTPAALFPLRLLNRFCLIRTSSFTT